MKAREILKNHAREIYTRAIKENMPNEAVERAIKEQIEKNAPNFVNKTGKLILISIGKASWEMAKTAHSLLKDKIDCGVVITKYGHIPKEMCKSNLEKGCPLGYLDSIELYEAMHPVVDFNGVQATKRALSMVENLEKSDTVLFLVSGGGSALFEDVSCPLEKMQNLTSQLLKCGADINEINAIRKHISNVKGGRFAQAVCPASIFAVALSDVIGDDLSTIASGPACADTTTVDDCLRIIDKYGLCLDEEMLSLIKRETPKCITNATHMITGSVSLLCESAKKTAQELGYSVMYLDSSITADAKSTAEFLVEKSKEYYGKKENIAIILGGEVTVEVKGNGIGGRNQELALRCAKKIDGLEGICVFCVGSDGTDGPTDAAGGYVDFESYKEIMSKGASFEDYLENNDSYNALKTIDGLIFTGPTGTNVNDLYVLLINQKEER